MGKKRGEECSDVDEIIRAVKSCSIAGDVSTADSVITGQLGKLSLEEGNKEKQVVVVKRQAKEDDERGDTAASEKEGEEEGEKGKGTKTDVKLEAVSFVDIEEEEESASQESGLVERGPMHGVPSNFDTDVRHRHITNKAYLPYSSCGVQMNDLNGVYNPVMPKNFPCHTSIENINYGIAMKEGSHKRGMNDEDIHYEPQKYVRPQNADVGMPGQMMMMNNLNAQGSICGGSAAGTKVRNNVYTTQMSGGTVYATEDTPVSVEQIMSGGTMGPGINGNSVDNQQHLNYGHIAADVPDDLIFNLDYPDFQNLRGENLVNVDDLLEDNDTSNVAPVPGVQQKVGGVPRQQIGGVGVGGVSNCQGPMNLLQMQLPPVSTAANNSGMTTSYPSHQQQYDNYRYHPQQQQQQQQQFQQFTDAHSKKRGSYSSGCDDMTSDGYASDLSPSHEMASPTPSPQSMMAASPATHHGSPPRSNLSPPPSNMSTFSVDSGVCSPMSEDQNGYAHPIKSPHQTRTAPWMSPPSRMTSVSPPMTSVSPHYPQMMSPLQSTGKSPLQQQPILAAKPTTAPKAQRVATENTEWEYCDPYIDGHLYELNIALQVASEDLIEGSMKKVPDVIGSAVRSKDGRNPGPNPGQAQNKGLGGQQPTKPLPPGAIVITTVATQPSYNSEGKIAIPPISKPAQPQGQMVPVMVFVPQQIAVQKTPPRFPPIAPKPNDSPADAKGKSDTAGTSQSPNRSPSIGQGQNSGSAGAKRANNTKLLNLARRLVAEMSADDLKFKDSDGDTYLHVAVCKADKYMVQALLERLVREKLSDMIDVQNNMGQSPLYLAVSTNHAEMVQLLVTHGADVNPFAECVHPTGVREKLAAIHCAAARGEKHLETLSALLKAPDINLNQVNSDGHTALHCAIRAHGKDAPEGTHLNSIPIIQTLIQAGADPNLQVQQSGKTALMYALESRQLDLIECIFQLVEPSKLSSFLKTQAFDGSTCFKIAERLKAILDPADQLRLQNILRLGHGRGLIRSLSPSSSPSSVSSSSSSP